MRGGFELVAVPREVLADFEAWLRRYGRELLPLPSGEMVVSRPRVTRSAEPYDGPDADATRLAA